jgi:hypothetical protein
MLLWLVAITISSQITFTSTFHSFFLEKIFFYIGLLCIVVLPPCRHCSSIFVWLGSICHGFFFLLHCHFCIMFWVCMMLSNLSPPGSLANSCSQLGAVAQTCNLSHSGGSNGRITVSGQPWQKRHKTPSQSMKSWVWQRVPVIPAALEA